MTTPEPPISPKGVPSLRTDWLADVARRLASVGFASLRALDEDAHGHLTDTVDGREWTFQLIKFSEPHDTVVEFDAELWAPDDDRAKPTLRAGFALAPRWDETVGGEVALVRTEIGPRGAVTFDPENWMVTVPLSGDGVVTSSPAGVQPGEWTFDGGLPVLPEPTTASHDALLASLPGTRLELRSIGPLTASDLVPELVLAAFPPAPAKARGFFGRLRGASEPEAPAVTILLIAAGPIELAWTGSGPVEDIVERGLVLGDAPPVLEQGQLTFRGADGVLTLTGPALTVTLS